MSTAIVWFRRNLRLSDNPALEAAANSGHPLLAVYVLDELDQGGASRWWLHHSLAALTGDLREHGGRLTLLKGEPSQELAKLARASNAAAVYFQRRYEPQAKQQEEQLDDALGDDLELCANDAATLVHPTRVLTQSDTPYKVFTPFWRSASECADPGKPQPVPATLDFAEIDAGLTLDELELLPTKPDWASGLRDTWSPGEDGAHARLDLLEDTVGNYKQHRDRPDLDNTSRLSPHLHFGEISPRQAWHAVHRMGMDARSSTGADALLRQLFWRDFSSYMLFHFPDLPDTPLKPEFAKFPWADDDNALRAWQ
ncbi:MAG: deoxyribodipyrimidine photo-lyase, partial [Gammaproteobacteria bacterium]|nr:deoxyribodipyrimidine photo-lyase [Gammaproteobacteria bacterium]